MNRHNHKKVKEMVRTILTECRAARESYDVLYTEYLKRVNPHLVTAPFYATMNNKSIPSYQSVARASRAIKNEMPWLRETEHNKAKREEIEESYFMEYSRI